jgi:anaerobic magnesium-protoporphyrin IX monomethyl ester cyclase
MSPHTSTDSHQALDLVLVNMPIHDFSTYPHYVSTHSAPLGLLSIATAADAAGFSVRVIDAELHQLAPAQVAQRIAEVRPRWVGMNTFSVNAAVLTQVLQAARGAFDGPIVVGGPHVTNVSLDYVRATLPGADYVVRGDGEEAMCRLLAGADPHEVPGVHALDESATGSPPGVYLSSDAIPRIDRRFSEGEPIARLGGAWYGVTMSRGCKFRCRFCSGSVHSNGMPYRADARGAVGEIEHLAGQGATGIRLVDDLPFLGKKALHAFLLEVAERDMPRLSWDINFPLQYCRTVTFDEWRALRDLGLETVTLGVESADESLRTALGKRIRAADLERVIDALLENGIAVKLYFIIGTPEESGESCRETVELAVSLSQMRTRGTYVDCNVFIYKPMPGSRLWSELRDAGYSEAELLAYADFELTEAEFQKHAWRSDLSLAELPPEALTDLVDEFYRRAAHTAALGSNAG